MPIISLILQGNVRRFSLLLAKREWTLLGAAKTRSQKNARKWDESHKSGLRFVGRVFHGSLSGYAVELS
jgi:hypothetical protein